MLNRSSTALPSAIALVLCLIGMAFCPDRLPAADSKPPVIQSTEDLKTWLPGTIWKQEDARIRREFREEIIVRPRGKTKDPWKIIGLHSIEVSVAKGKRVNT